MILLGLDDEVTGQVRANVDGDGKSCEAAVEEDCEGDHYCRRRTSRGAGCLNRPELRLWLVEEDVVGRCMLVADVAVLKFGFEDQVDGWRLFGFETEEQSVIVGLT